MGLGSSFFYIKKYKMNDCTYSENIIILKSYRKCLIGTKM